MAGRYAEEWLGEVPCFSGSGCPFIEGYILYNMIKQDAVGVWTPRTPPVAPAPGRQDGHGRPTFEELSMALHETKASIHSLCAAL